MMRFYKTPWIAKARYPELTWSLNSKQSIYLTFDDGPNPIVTPWVLNELRKENAKATFFCLGENIANYKSLAKEILAQGHSIGNHTQNHLNGWKSGNLEYQDNISACDDELAKLGVSNQLFRPPYGRLKKNQIDALKNKKIIMWSHLSWDFDKNLNLSTSLKKLKSAGCGSILTFHDSKKAFDNLKILLPEILSHFSSKGIQFEALK